MIRAIMQHRSLGGGVPAIGTLWEGGYFAGCIAVNSSIYALILGPKSSQILTTWKTSNTDSPGTGSVNDGWTNTNNINDSNHPAAQYCRSLSIGGKNDWYLASRDEWNVVYRAFKPASFTTEGRVYNGANSPRAGFYGRGDNTYLNYPPVYGMDDKGDGDNRFYVDIATGKVGAPAYALASPPVTTLSIFLANGSQCLGLDPNNAVYTGVNWYSDNYTYFSSSQMCAIEPWGLYVGWYQSYMSEKIGNWNMDFPKTRTSIARPIRRILIS